MQQRNLQAPGSVRPPEHSTTIFSNAHYVNTYGTGNVSEEKLGEYLHDIVDLSPRGIRERLGLSRPIYARTAAYGHFGRQPEPDGGFSWEKLDLVAELENFKT